VSRRVCSFATPRSRGLSRLSEPDREAGRRHSLKPHAVDVGAFAALDLEPHVDDAVGPVFLGFASQGLDSRLTVRFGAGITGCQPGPRRPDSTNRNRTPAVIERGRKTHLHEVQSIC